MNHNKAITILFVAFLATACARPTPTEPGQPPVQQSEPVALVECDKVPDFFFPSGAAKESPQPNEIKLGRFEVCTTPAACVVGNSATLADVALAYCQGQQGPNCTKANCAGLGPECQAVALLDDTPTVSLANPALKTSLRCSKPGEQLCSIDLILAANKKVRCGCKCGNPKA